VQQLPAYSGSWPDFHYLTALFIHYKYHVDSIYKIVFGVKASNTCIKSSWAFLLLPLGSSFISTFVYCLHWPLQTAGSLFCNPSCSSAVSDPSDLAAAGGGGGTAESFVGIEVHIFLLFKSTPLALLVLVSYGLSSRCDGRRLYPCWSDLLLWAMLPVAVESQAGCGTSEDWLLIQPRWHNSNPAIYCIIYCFGMGLISVVKPPAPKLKSALVFWPFC